MTNKFALDVMTLRDVAVVAYIPVLCADGRDMVVSNSMIKVRL